MNANEILSKLILPDELKDILLNCQSLIVAKTVDDLINASVKDEKDGYHIVSYNVPGKGEVKEAYVCRVKNGISANYYEPYMRRRDPDSMLIADDLPTDKPRYSDVYKRPFKELRDETFEWLKNQNLMMFVFLAGQIESGIYSIAIAPDNAGFFALGLAELQGIINPDTIDGQIKPKCFLYIAPPFRFTHFNEKQYVVHNRGEDMYEIFSYNLYPGPSAKKGIYGTLIHYGEMEGWVTNHAAVVKVVTPYGMKVAIMHEGASGGGKSEMNEHIHRESDGTIHFAKNVITGENRHLSLPKGCTLHPVADDMALCHPSIQKGDGKMVVVDAENAWFIRVDHIKNYGTDPDIEARSIHPPKPLLFLNIDATPGSTALLWDHIMDEPGKACPNPRFILPRDIVPGVTKKPVSIDIRSFGVRTPPCTREKPTYGIIGLFQVMPPALGWLWRLVSPRGHDNPSIVDKEGMNSEGVGSYWPFATGKKVNQANLLLKQIIDNPNTHYILCPVRHIGAWDAKFVPQWIAREFLARRGGVRFAKDELTPSRCSILGYSLSKFEVEGQSFDQGFLQVDKQIDVGVEAFDKGAEILSVFFKKQLQQFLQDDLMPLGRKIIECCMNDGKLEDYTALLKGADVFVDDLNEEESHKV